MLKKKLCPLLSFFPSSSSSEHSDHSSYNKDSNSEYQDTKKQLLHSSSPPPCYTLFESHLGSSPSTLSAIENISRGLNSHFVAHPYLEDTTAMHNKIKTEFPQSPGHDNHEGSKSGSFRESLNSCSVRSEKRMIQDLPSAGQDNHSKCLTLMKEQEELKSLTISNRTQTCEKEQRQTKSVSPVRTWTGVNLDETILKFQDIPLRQKAQKPNKQVLEHRRGCYFGNTSSPMDRLPTSNSPYIQWDISPVTSPTSQTPFLSISEGNTTECMLPDTQQRCLEAVEDSTAENISHSTVTQYTSLSILPHHRDSSCYKSDISKAQVRSPEKPIDRELSSSRNLTENHRMPEKEIKTQASVFTSTCAVPDPPLFERAQHSTEMEKEASPDGHFPKLCTNFICSFTDSSIITNDNQKNGRDIRKGDKASPSSLLQLEEEKEGTRACSRKSDKFVFSVSPNYISPLPLLENEAESDQSNFSIRLSEPLKANFVSQPERMSPLQPSTILEYLSLPGFVEMSVDEPLEECQEDESTSRCTKQTDRSKPDVIPKNLENQDRYHLKESDDNQSRFLVDLDISTFPMGHSIPDNVTTSKPCLELAQGNTSKNPGSSETTCISTQFLSYEGRQSQPLFSYKSFGSDKSTHLSLAQSLVSPKEVYNIPYQGDSMEESLSEHTQWCQPQHEGTNQVSARIPQAPVPFMKKSFSIGPCRTHSGMGQPHPFLRKSISLGSQKLEQHQTSRTYASCNCHKDDLPHLGVKDKIYSLGCRSADSSQRFSTSQQVPRHAQPYRSYDLDRPCYSESPYMTPSNPMHAQGLSVQGPLKPYRHYRRESDPRRQATIFPESLRCPLSYQETLRLVQHRYVPQCPPRPLIAPRMVARWDNPHSIDSKKSFQRPFLPRGYSWPSPHQAPLSSGVQRELYGVGKSRDSTGEGGRASYASQSSGRGSVGPFWHVHQSLSVTPTLMGFPETTKESGRYKRESNLQERGSKR